jgi:hypothetical protein
MKKVIKHKLLFQNGCSKNFLLWEIAGRNGIVYEIVEEFKGQSIARSMLRGIYRDRIKALASFKQVLNAESPSRTPLRQVVFG